MPLDLGRLNEMRQGFSHLKNTTDLEREYLQEMLDLFQTRASTELNRFVRQITAWGTIGIAWTVIVGIYGMNFAHMPELNNSVVPRFDAVAAACGRDASHGDGERPCVGSRLINQPSRPSTARGSDHRSVGSARA